MKRSIWRWWKVARRENLVNRNIKARSRRFTRWVKSRILHIDDSPSRIAMGVALGVFVAWTPAIGLHIIMVLIASLVLRTNKLAALAAIWINNPITAIPMFYGGYVLGRGILSCCTGTEGLSGKEMLELLKSMGSPGEFFLNFHHAAFWKEIFSAFVRVGVELWIGCTILGIVTGAASYFIAYKWVIKHREKIERKRRAAILASYSAEKVKLVGSGEREKAGLKSE